MDFNELRASDLMRTDPILIDEQASIAAAAKLMNESGVSSLLIDRSNENDAFGIVTRKDIVEAAANRSVGGFRERVEDIMSKPALTVNPSLSITHCLQIMKMVGVRRLPVVEGDKLVGILSNTDIFRKIVKEME